MALITIPYVFTPNTTIKSAEVNANFDTVANEINGSLDTNNLSATAGIVAGQLSNPITFVNGQIRQSSTTGEIWSLHIDGDGNPYWTRES